MKNNNTKTYIVKREIVNYSKKLSNSLSKPDRKFVLDMAYGIAATGSSKISDISRALNENIELINTIDRLCSNLKNFNYRKQIWNNNFDIIKPLLDEKPIILFDDTDIVKEYGNKFESLGEVVDGSDTSKKVKPGYRVCNAVALTKDKQPLSIYSHLYSEKEEGFISVNDETLKMLDYVNGKIKGGIYVGDRGFDNIKLFKKLNNIGSEFVIRGRNNRKVINKGRNWSVSTLAKTRKGKVKFKFKEFDLYVSHLKIMMKSYKPKNLNMVIVHGFSENNPMILYTNKEIRNKDDVLEVVKLYLIRWRVEENFRLKKCEFGYEKFRVRSLNSIRNIEMFINLVMNLCTLLNSKKNTKLRIKIIKAAKALRDDVDFWLYQIATGIRQILSKCDVGVKGLQKIEKRKYIHQLKLIL